MAIQQTPGSVILKNLIETSDRRYGSLSKDNATQVEYLLKGVGTIFDNFEILSALIFLASKYVNFNI
jgi:hypothetical protein